MSLKENDIYLENLLEDYNLSWDDLPAISPYAGLEDIAKIIEETAQNKK